MLQLTRTDPVDRRPGSPGRTVGKAVVRVDGLMAHPNFKLVDGVTGEAKQEGSWVGQTPDSVVENSMVAGRPGVVGHLAQGVSKAEALRLARVDLMGHPSGSPDITYAAPYFWAPFILVGSAH